MIRLSLTICYKATTQGRKPEDKPRAPGDVNQTRDDPGVHTRQAHATRTALREFRVAFACLQICYLGREQRETPWR